MSVLETSFEETVGEPVGDWHPSRHTPSLTGTEEFRTDGDKLIRFAHRYWRTPEFGRLVLDDWQRWLVRHVLERYPDDWPVEHLRGELRFRQVVISMGRQNGKSLLGALFVIYFLALHVRGPRVIGLASVDRQAKIVYDRVRYGIDNEPALERELKTTGTRGISRRDGSGVYFTLPAKEESAQGEPASGVLYDELHLGLAALWDAMVLAQRARRNSLMIGITTEGDDDSQLLIRLYAEGEAAIDGADERFGFYVWEGADDVLNPENVIAANPAIACGRVPLDIALSDARKMAADTRKGPDGLTGWQRVVRYTLNRHIEGAVDSWASSTAWRDGRLEDGLELEHDPDAVLTYSVERTAEWEHASITATSRAADGTYRTELVASLVEPDLDVLEEACVALARGGRPAFVMDSKTLAKLADRLRDRGLSNVWKLAEHEMSAAAALAKSLVGRRLVVHPGDPLLRMQFARARRRDTGDSWRLSRSLSGGDIDAVVGLVMGLYVATVREDDTVQLW